MRFKVCCGWGVNIGIWDSKSTVNGILVLGGDWLEVNLRSRQVWAETKYNFSDSGEYILGREIVGNTKAPLWDWFRCKCVILTKTEGREILEV